MNNFNLFFFRCTTAIIKHKLHNWWDCVSVWVESRIEWKHSHSQSTILNLTYQLLTRTSFAICLISVIQKVFSVFVFCIFFLRLSCSSFNVHLFNWFVVRVNGFSKLILCPSSFIVYVLNGHHHSPFTIFYWKHSRIHDLCFVSMVDPRFMAYTLKTIT